jgi:nucleoside-diphosphate-sugar epimerase
MLVEFEPVAPDRSATPGGTTMISGEKILITGVTGSVAEPLARFLAAENEVWGVARFADGAADRRQALEDAGVITRAVDLGSGSFGDLPEDFTYVLHLAWMRADFARLQDAMRVNVEGTGLVLQHCRRAKAALVMSSTAVYSGRDDPWYAYSEDDPLGQGATGQTAMTSPTTKVGAESVARFCARAFDLPVVIARLSTFMGTPNSFPGYHIQAVLGGYAMPAPHDPSPHSPIHIDDMKEQLEAILGAAGNPAFITNWCGDEVVTAQDWVRDAAALSGKEGKLVIAPPVPGAPAGSVSDPTRRRSITGPCTTNFEQSFRQLYETIVSPGA